MLIRTLTLIGLALLSPVLSAQVLLSTVSPATATPGVTVVNVTGSGFPSGTLTPSNVILTLAPASTGGGPTISVPASGLATVTGTIRRVSFTVPAALIVTAPTAYLISLADEADKFSSTNTAAITINPTARISGVAPNSGTQGQTTSVTVTGQYSNFLQSLSTVSAGSGITVSNVSVLSPTSLTATFAIDANATLGSRPVTVTSGGETATLAAAFTINAGQATITGLSPSSAQQGQTVNIGVTGTSTNFVAGTTAATLGGGVTVNTVTVIDSTHATVNASINPTTGVGPRTLTLTTGTSIVSSAFSIASGPASISSLTPNAASQGQTFSIIVSGISTHFAVGTTADFGSGISVTSVSITSATSATFGVTIQDNAVQGKRDVTVTTGGEIAAIAGGFTVNQSQPLILSVTPNFATQGQSVQSVAVVGRFTHFINSTSTASFGAGITVGSFTVTDPAHATANIIVDPLAAIGPRDVKVTTATESVTLAGAFTVQPSAAAISSLNPNSGQQGRTLAGVTITGQGTHFLAATPTVTFTNAGILASSLAVVDNTHLTVTLTIAGNAPVGASNVMVATGAESAIGSGVFSVTAATPTILSVSPSSASQIQGVIPVTITGAFTHFTQGAPVVTFGIAGIVATGVQVTDDTHLRANLTIAASTIPGSSTVTVTTGSETASGGTFTIIGLPFITSSSPATGQQGQTLTNVAITGNFTHFVQGSTTVAFSNTGVVASTVSVSDATHLTATLTIEAGAIVGASNITVTTGTEAAIGNGLFTVTAVTPVILSLNPPSGLQGQTLNGVVITGNFTHFTNTPAVTFGNAGIRASAVTVTDATHLTATLIIANNAAAGASNVTVITGSETATGTGLFTVGTATPIITTLSQTTGQQGQVLTNVAITGAFTHFVQGSTAVALSNPGITASAISVVDATHLTATLTIAGGATLGASNITVSTGTEAAIGNGLFTVTAGTPVILSLNPSSGLQGQTLNGVVITGNFTHFVGTPVVTFSNTGITASSVTVTDATHLIATLTIASNGTPGASNVTVITGSETAPGTGLFTVNAGTPILTNLSKPSGAQGQTLTGVVITGTFTHFVQGTTTLSFSNAGISASAITVSDATHLTATLTIATGATLGVSNVTATTGAEAAIGNGLFTVTAGTPVILSLNPSSGLQGQTLNGVTFTGNFTHFAGTPAITFSNTGVSASAITVTDPTHLTTTLTIASNAAAGASNVTVVTGSETATGTGLFTVGTGTPVITTLSQTIGQQGQTLTNVAITGTFTHFVQSTTTINFSNTGITASTILVTDNTHLTATLTITPTASLGASTLTVTTGTEAATGTGLFTVTAGTPVILSLNPASGLQGQTLTGVTITGNFTHFNAGSPAVTFSNTGITASAVAVSDATHLTATLTISPTAAIGASNITITTGSETVTGSGLFSVTAGTPVITSVSPTSAPRGQTVAFAVTGAFTHFTQGISVLSFQNPGISASGLVVTDTTHLTASLIIASTATLDVSNVTVTTGSEVATGPKFFTITPGTPTISTLTPSTGLQGQILTGVAVVGSLTHFTQAAPTLTFSNTGIAASAINVADDTHLTATLTISPTATLGASNISIAAGTETATGSALFTVSAGTPAISSVVPSAGAQGQTLTGVAVTGSLTHFTQAAPRVTFSNTGITATDISVIDNTHLTATLTILSSAVTGASNISVTTGTETANGASLFAVNAALPVITSLTPSTIQQGQQGISFAITGQATHFVQGTTTASFGAGITVASLTVNSATSATAIVNVNLTAALGPRTLTVTTGSEIATLAGTLTVTVAPPSITITAPTNLTYTNISTATVNGTVSDPTATVTVNGLGAPVANGTFSVPVPLAEGPNILTGTATSTTGIAGTASIQVTLDTTPPRVTITNPPDQFVTTSASIAIGGSINDIVVGTVNSAQAQVTVNGSAAQVSNRMFLANNIALNIGSNVIQAVGRDQAGNAATTQITVIRQAAAAQPVISLISGDGQTGTIGSVLPSALVVAVKDASGNPVANQQVIFKVDQNNGMVSAGGQPAATVVATTNSAGQAQTQWTLGGRAGAGGNTVEAYAVGFKGTAMFTATGNQGPAGMIVVDTGNNQTGEIGKSLAKPLIAVVIDAGNNRLAGVPVTFTVKQGGGNIGGQQSVAVTSDSDGRVSAILTLGSQEGNLNNLVEASFSSNPGFPGAFVASARAAGAVANTSITGLVLDNSNQPIPAVTIRAVLSNQLTSNSSSAPSAATALTDAQGLFTISPAPVGFVKLLVDGSTAQLKGTYPTLDYDLVTVAGQKNTLGMPVFLLPLKTSNQICVTPTTGGGTLTMPEAPGFSLTFGPGQVTFPGGAKTGCVSVTLVHPDKVPMTPGFGQQPRFIVTIQPAGALFNPPAPITLPNVDGLAPRVVAEMYSFDHDIASFVAIGTGVVSDDGLVLRSSSGVGVLKAGWHCGGNSATSGTPATCGSCAVCVQNNCQPDPTRLNASCQNPCVVGGSGNCSSSGYCTGTNLPDGTSCNSYGGSCQNGQCLGGGAGGNGGQCPYSCNSRNLCINDACVGSQCSQAPNPNCRSTCGTDVPSGTVCSVGIGISGTCQNGQCDICGNLADGTACVSGPATFGVCQGGRCSGSCTPPSDLLDCPNRQPRPLPYIPTSDGCSVPSALLAVLGPLQSLPYSGDPNNPAGGAHTQFGNAARNGPCDKHDYCWGTCSKYSRDDTTNREICNLDFDSDMHHVCFLAGIAGDPASVVDLCDKWADVIADAVDNNLGGIPNRKYVEAQKQACVCCR